MYVRVSRMRIFVQSAALRYVASITQESLPCTSLHASRRHRLRSAPGAERCQTDPLVLFHDPQVGCSTPVAPVALAASCTSMLQVLAPRAGRRARWPNFLMKWQVGEVPDHFRRLRRAMHGALWRS